ncbi:hypothetical protein ACGF5F_32725 [Streptomyces sp. NPDC047821]|uniref:hypothetical protein n=1 Tax=Streptomyces sp. NPDC047821 TaxID=3365488 RepID=UPI00372229EB
MSASEPRTIQTLAASLGISVQEALKAAKNFTTNPGRLLVGEVPPKVASRIEAYFREQ